MTSTTYPNGQVLVSSALTVPQINDVLQPLTCGMLGINPPDLSKVRVDWQQQGQPFVGSPTQDVCFLSCVPFDVEYSRIRDKVRSGTSPVTETWLYTRGWNIAWCFYGPSSTDNARMLHSALLFIDYFSDSLSLSNLYPVSDPPEPTRVPENFNAQWWERADFHCIFYEQITETITYAPVTSVEVKLNADNLGQVADITVTP